MVARQTQGPFHGGVERPMQHHIVHPWGLNQLRELHAPRETTAWGMMTPAGERRLIGPEIGAPNGRAERSSPAPVGRVRQGLRGAHRPGRSPASLPHYWSGLGSREGLAAGPCNSRCHRPLTGGLRWRRTRRRAASEPEPLGTSGGSSYWLPHPAVTPGRSRGRLKTRKT